MPERWPLLTWGRHHCKSSISCLGKPRAQPALACMLQTQKDALGCLHDAAFKGFISSILEHGCWGQPHSGLSSVSRVQNTHACWGPSLSGQAAMMGHVFGSMEGLKNAPRHLGKSHFVGSPSLGSYLSLKMWPLFFLSLCPPSREGE